MLRFVRELVKQTKEIPDKESFIIAELKKRFNVSSFPSFDIVNGSTHGTVYLVYCTLSEYLILYRVSFRNAGYTCRYAFDIYDFVIKGSLITCDPDKNQLTNFYEVIENGDFSYLPALTTKYYEVEKDTLLLEYAKGFIPSAITGVLCHFMSTFDVLGTIKIFYVWSKKILQSYLNG
jgi:hypothetical protein